LAAAAMQATLEQKPDGDSAGWENPTTGHRGSVRPTVTFVSDAGFFCRDYEEALSLADGRNATIMNTACRDTKGYWAWLADWFCDLGTTGSMRATLPKLVGIQESLKNQYLGTREG
jgi:hypothetical protein